MPVRLALIVALLVFAGTAYAQFNGCPAGFCPGGFGGGGGGGLPANALLSQTGVCIEAQTGSCILVQ